MELFQSTLKQSAMLFHNIESSLLPFRPTIRIRPSRFSCSSSKKTSFQDFRDYAKPKRLFPSGELKTTREEPPHEITKSRELDGSNSLYKVLLCTSSFNGSDLTNQNGGILVCIIDEYGDSILERIPAILSRDRVQQFENDVIFFQRGSKDEFIFLGPKLGRIQAMWIGLDSGSWRLGGATLTIIDSQKGESSPKENMYYSTTYKFEVEDVLLGERNDLSMVELRPCQITENLGEDSMFTIDTSSEQSMSISEKEITKEKSLKEYKNLKYSLLLYDSVLILGGTSIALLTKDKNTALSFLTGGIGGFLYLLTLQRSVDSLPSTENNTTSTKNYLGGVKGPILVLIFAFIFVVLVTKHDNPDLIVTFITPKEILAGMLGFLACKVSVLLAAFKPLSIISLEDDE